MALDNIGRDIVWLFDCVGAHVSKLLFQSRPLSSKGARPRVGKSVWHKVGNLAVLDQQTRIRHTAAFLVHGDGISRYANVTGCHSARHFSADAALVAGRISPGTMTPRPLLNCTTMIFSATGLSLALSFAL